MLIALILLIILNAVLVLLLVRPKPPVPTPVVDLSEVLAAVAESNSTVHGTLDRRLGDSFKLVGDRLDLVHRGLGEMQSLATNVSDLKRVLSNVKTRGVWGEVQLGRLLEQMLHPGQYEKNVCTKTGSNERVEFAIKLPAKDLDKGHIWLPIDAKFPQEDYLRLLDATPETVDAIGKAFETQIRSCAQDIANKYINPPATTDFGVMFVPSEGIFAEIVRRTALVERIQRDHRIVVMGPTTLGALLNSLQIGFSTLAIQQRSSEVWTTLAAVRTEFGKFSEIIAKLSKKLQEATSIVEDTETRTRVLDRKLKNLELPE
jgi:DNA recombination protein RmuC